ncbi:MAG: Gfo/Idh/MocA family oxidoreductase [Pseudomonadota bacterium]
MSHGTAIIGLGIMGQRMLGNMRKYAGFDIVCVWDPDPLACQRVRETYPDIIVADSASAAIDNPDVSVVYIASPPRFHAVHAHAAMDAGKAVYCEKPLDVDDARAAGLVDHAAKAGVVNIVNFSLAAALATTEIERRIQSGATGALSGLDIRLHFSTWPRGWQMDAASWLSYREDGGFAREVLSHWIYLTQRLLGAPELTHAATHYPPAPAAETHVTALLEAGGVPVTVAGSVGGAGPDLVEATFWGSDESLRVFDWNQLYASNGGEFVRQLVDVDDPREAGYDHQLQAASRAIDREASPMPTFADALAVQRIIEAILAAA